MADGHGMTVLVCAMDPLGPLALHTVDQPCVSKASYKMAIALLCMCLLQSGGRRSSFVDIRDINAGSIPGRCWPASARYQAGIKYAVTWIHGQARALVNMHVPLTLTMKIILVSEK